MRGETAKEECNRASDARCAGVPNLGRIGRAQEDFLPQLCGRSCGQMLTGERKPQRKGFPPHARVARLKERACLIFDVVEHGVRFVVADLV